MLSSLAQALLTPSLVRLQHRAMWWPFGLFPFHSQFDVRKLKVCGQLVELQFPTGEGERQQWELRHLLIDDPYRLRATSGKITTILDIGANVGLFAILARHYFPQSIIHSYEPNPELQPLILSNTQKLSVTLCAEGVGLHSGRATMATQADSLNGRLCEGLHGSIPITSFKEAVSRLGGGVDFLKVDCEGGEWDILQDSETLKKVNQIAMEFHLAHPKAQSLSWLVRHLNDNGFAITSLSEAPQFRVGQLTAVRL